MPSKLLFDFTTTVTEQWLCEKSDGRMDEQGGGKAHIQTFFFKDWTLRTLATLVAKSDKPVWALQSSVLLCWASKATFPGFPFQAGGSRARCS